MKSTFFLYASVSLISSFVAKASCPLIDPSVNKQAQQCLSTQYQDEKVHLSARKFTQISEDEFSLDGNVCVKQGDLSLLAPEILYHRKSQSFNTKGDVLLQSSDQQVSARNAEVDAKNNSAILTGLSFKLLDSDVNGSADQLITQNRMSELQRLTFSTCNPEARDWEIVAKEAVLDHDEGVGTFKKATLRFKNVPIFYFPWVKLPLNDDRRSGFLIPGISYSDNTGLDLSIPYYINISSNIDATLTPRYLQDHGLMLGAQFRYLTERNTGVFDGTFLANDDIRNRDRSLLEYKHQTRISNNWSFNADINNVTDSQYFEDFASSSFLTSTPYLRSSINVRGNNEHWSFYAGFDDYQVLSEQITNQSEPYQKLPEISFAWFDYNLNQRISYGIDSQVVNFYRENSVNAWRSDLQPWIEKKFSNAWSWVTPKLEYRSTHYQFDDNRQSINRNLPIYSVDMGLKFEKNHNNDAYNTLEPRLFYVYAPDRDQNDIPLFDTHGLTFGSALLFQTNQFSGADRQSDMNQVSAALTHRSFDRHGFEKWNLTLGQIKYFDDQSVQLDNSSRDLDKSPFIAEINYYLMKNWSASIIMHYDQNINKTERGLIRLQRRDEKNNLFNFAYRFRRNNIEQIDTSFVIPINEKHRLLARWNYSLENNSTIESLFGYEHKNCCWAFRLMARKYLTDETGRSSNGIYAEIQFNGLGSLGRSPRRILKQSILGYQEEY